LGRAENLQRFKQFLVQTIGIQIKIFKYFEVEFELDFK
jgi:hypothetical protein